KYEKLKLMENELSLTFEFFPTISQINSESQPSQKTYINHNIYQSIVNHNYRSALILEDSIDFEFNIKSIMVDIHRILPPNWEILYLGHCNNWEGKSGEPLPDYKHGQSIYKLFISYRPYCTHAYAVSHSGALKLLKKLVNLTAPIDLELTNIITANEINSYTIIPPVISRCHISDEPINLYPGRDTLDLYSLNHSTLHSLGLNYELNNTLGFSHIYVINLINRQDRREKLEILAKKLNLKFEFFPAVSQDDENELKELEVKNSILKPSQIACYLSHYKVYQSIIQHGYDSALILEDD
ncbi:10362_t:CDS:1, partial [Racocetra fulgida]